MDELIEMHFKLKFEKIHKNIENIQTIVKDS